MKRISYQQFAVLDLRVGKIISAEDVAGADRLVRIKVDIGEETPRVLLAGIKQYYQPEDLVCRTVVVLTNLEPKKIRGEMSDGMILAASTDNFESVKLLTIDGDLPAGARIS